ncbi:ribosome biogenesis GTPase YlqF [Atopococcus tabaci]|uniref:ribosome biogenesis GTPase YlqF n=1 Tax=Atopococcus tabaci TaxID=269774 RepID=UPI000424D95C|nr:ribosome biogenesis GTPase YlqF [Atopococcus tabaci]
MPIQWYPGHMAKAKREFQEKLKLVDVVLELVDARIPQSSRNPDLDSIIGDKPRVVILMKADLADPAQTEKWAAYFESQGVPTVSIDAQEGRDVQKVQQAAKKALTEQMKKRAEKGMKPRAIRAVIVGIPNVGKSTLINRMARKKVAQTGNKPGVTKAQQWIKYGKELELLDTPGILWPKFEDQEVGKCLALTGAIRDRLLYMDDIALYGMELLRKYYPGALAKRYRLDESEEELELPELLMRISEKRGFRDDYDRAAEMLVFELRRGQLGRVTLDRIEDVEEADDYDTTQ